MTGNVLEADGISVAFGGVQALDDVDLHLAEGEQVGLIGSNGSGKSTLLNVVSGSVKPDRGQVRLLGRDVSRSAPHVRARRGLARTFQDLKLFERLSVRDHLRVGREGSRSRSAPPDKALLDGLGLSGFEDSRTDVVGFGLRRSVEIARALAAGPRVLLLDEPAAGLNTAETERLAEALRTLVRDRGITLLLIEHNVGFVMNVCDRVVALDSGRVIASGTPAEVRAHPEVIAAYLGTGQA